MGFANLITKFFAREEKEGRAHALYKEMVAANPEMVSSGKCLAPEALKHKAKMLLTDCAVVAAPQGLNCAPDVPLVGSLLSMPAAQAHPRSRAGVENEALFELARKPSFTRSDFGANHSSMSYGGRRSEQGGGVGFNPATGLPMYNDGIDIGGNALGFDNALHSTDTGVFGSGSFDSFEPGYNSFD